MADKFQIQNLAKTRRVRCIMCNSKGETAFTFAVVYRRTSTLTRREYNGHAFHKGTGYREGRVGWEENGWVVCCDNGAVTLSRKYSTTAEPPFWLEPRDANASSGDYRAKKDDG